MRGCSPPAQSTAPGLASCADFWPNGPGHTGNRPWPRASAAAGTMSRRAWLGCGGHTKWSCFRSRRSCWPWRSAEPWTNSAKWSGPFIPTICSTVFSAGFVSGSEAGAGCAWRNGVAWPSCLCQRTLFTFLPASLFPSSPERLDQLGVPFLPGFFKFLPLLRVLFRQVGSLADVLRQVVKLQRRGARPCPLPSPSAAGS